MKSQKLFLFTFASFLIFTSLVSAVSVNCNLFYSDDPTAYTQTITDGDSISLVIDANTVLEEELTIKVGLYRDGAKVKDIMPSYTTTQEYFGTLNVKKSDYSISGNYTIRAFANSSSGSFSQNHLELVVEPIPITPDTTAPKVTILNPNQGGNYTTNKTSLTFQLIEDNIDYCQYNLNDGEGWKRYNCVNGTNIISGIKSEEGTNTWQIRATDKSSNIGGDFVTFNVASPIADITAPQIIIISPLDGQTYYTDSLEKNQFKFHIIEENLDYCEYNLYKGEGWKRYNCVNGTNNITELNFSIGNNLWEIRAIDLSGNLGSKMTSFSFEYVDNDDPIIKMITPKQNRLYPYILNQFLFEIEEAHLSKYCSYKLNNDSEKTFLCKNGLNIINDSAVEGLNTLEISAKDYLSGRTTTVETKFTINLSINILDIIPPTITIINPTDGEEFEENETIYVEIIADENCTVYYNINGTNATMNYVAGTLYNYKSNNFTLSEGNYTLTVYATDDSGNTAIERITFSVKKTVADDDDDDDDGGGGSDEDEDRERKPNEDNYLQEYPWNMTNLNPCTIEDIKLEPKLTCWQRFILWLKRLFGFA